MKTAHWKLRFYVAKVSKLISKGNKCSCESFQNNISFNIENIKQIQNLNNGRFTGHFMEIYMCGLDAASISLHVPESQSWRNPFCYYSCERQEPQLRLAKKLLPQTLTKCILTLSFQKFLQQSLKLCPSLLNMCWNMLVFCTSFYLALLQKICSLCAFLLKI